MKVKLPHSILCGIAFGIAVLLPTQVRALDLLGYWNFDDDTTPGVVPELSGNSPAATLGGPAVFSADGAGYSGSLGDRSLDLGGVNNAARAEVPAGTHLDAAITNNAMAVSVWQYNTGIGNTSTFWISSPTAGANVRGFQAHVPWSNGTVFFDHAGCCDGSQRITVGGVIQVNRWQHFVFQKDAAGRKQIWVDGNLAADQASGAAPLLPFDGRINIGNEVNTNGNGFGGRIDEFAVFDDALSPSQIAVLAAGGSPLELFFDGNDDAAATDEDSVLTKLSPATGTRVGGFNNAADLDFQGDFVYAVNARGPGGFSIGDAAFTDDAAPGVTLVSNNNVPDWDPPHPNLGDTPDDDNLEIVMQSIRWSSSPTTVNIDLANLEPGTLYQLQMLFFERTSDRGFDVSFEGTQVIDNFSPALFGRIDATPSVITHTFVAGDDTLNIVLDGSATPFVDKNPIIQGLTLERCEDSVLANDTGSNLTVVSADGISALGADVAVNGDGTFSYDPTVASNFEALNRGVVVNDTFSYTVAGRAPGQQLPPTTSTGEAGVVLGIGAAALLGNDLTDQDNVHDEVAYNPPGDFGGFDATFSANDKPGFGGSEFSFNVFDNAVGGGADKWCCNTPGPTTPDGEGLWVAAQFAQPYFLTHFTITSSNDTAGRDPRVWAIEGSNDGTSWAPVFSYNDTAASPFINRNEVLLYTSSLGRTDLTGGMTHFEPGVPYTYFRYFVDATGIATGAAHALNELEFFGLPAATDTATVNVAVTGVNDNPIAGADATETGEATAVSTLTTGGPNSLLDNDTDPDTGETATLEIIIAGSQGLGTHGTPGESLVLPTGLGAQLTINDDGTFSYDPSGSSTLDALGEGETASESIDYIVSDGQGAAPLGGVLADLALWLDSSDIDADWRADSLADGAAVTTWRDKSGHGRDAVLGAGAGNDPVYTSNSSRAINTPVVGFDGNDLLITNHDFDSLGRDYSIFTVARYSGDHLGNGDAERVFSSANHNWLFGFWGQSVERFYAEGWVFQGPQLGINYDTNWQLHTGIIDGTPADPQIDFYRNGNLLVANNTGSNNNVYKPGRLSIGAWQNNNQESSIAEVAEVIIFDRELSEPERLAVEAYLNAKYFGSGVAGTDRGTFSITVTGSNDTPSAEDDNYASDEDSSISAPGSFNLLQLDNLATGDYRVSADGDTFRAHVDHDGTNGWLLIGRGRNGWLFDNDPTTGQQSPGDVSENLRTPEGFAPAQLRDNIVLDLLNAAGVDMANVEIRLLRAGDNAGSGDYQEVIWSDFTGKGGVFSWDFDDAPYIVTQSRLNAPAGLPGATVGVSPGLDTRDQIAPGNNGNRVFTWPWGGHGNQQGFSYGQAVTDGSASSGSYFWEFAVEDHAIPYTEVYIRVTAPSQLAGLLLNDSDSEVDGGNPAQVLEIASAGPVTGSENVLPDTEALPNDPPAHVDSVTFSSALGATVTLYDDGGFDYDPSTSSALQALDPGDTMADTFVYIVTDNDPVTPLSDPATATILVTGVNDAPQVTPPGIPDITIMTSNPTATLPLFPHFEDPDGDDVDSVLSYVVTGNSNPSLIGTQSISSTDGLLVLDTPCDVIGSSDVTVTVTDPDSLSTADTFTVTVVDDVAPVLSGAKDVVSNAAVGGTATVSFPILTAFDKVDGALPVTYSPDESTAFGVGSHTITGSAEDASGNIGTLTFQVHILEIQPPGGSRVLDVLSLRGDAAPGAGGPSGLPASATIYAHNRAYLNNFGDIVYEASLLNAGSNGNAVFTSIGGTEAALAVRGIAAPDGGNFGPFSNLAIGDSGAAIYQSLVGGKVGQFVDASLAAKAGAPAPGTAGGEWIVLQKAAVSSSGESLTQGSLKIGVGMVTAAADTGIWGSTSGLLAREGSPSPITDTNYGQIYPRIVASNASEQLAFASFLQAPVPDANTNTALFVGTIGATPVQLARKGDPAPGISGASFFQFLAESVNSSGDVVFRAQLAGTGIDASNNDSLWLASGGGLQLIAREGAVAPCLPTTDAAFGRFTTLRIGDDGSVCFFTYLQDAGAVAAVNSANDGSLWRFEPADGSLHLIAREGDMANSTDGSVYQLISGFDCSSAQGVVFQATLVPGVGDSDSTTNIGVWLDRGLPDAAPELVLRRADTFDIDEVEHTVTGITLEAQSNAAGGTGGYGRIVNDAGEILLKVSLNNNVSGLFKIAPAG